MSDCGQSSLEVNLQVEQIKLSDIMHADNTTEMIEGFIDLKPNQLQSFDLVK